MILSLVSSFLRENIFLILLSSVVGSFRILSKFFRSYSIYFSLRNSAIFCLSLMSFMGFQLDLDLQERRLCPETERAFLKFLGFYWMRVFSSSLLWLKVDILLLLMVFLSSSRLISLLWSQYFSKDLPLVKMSSPGPCLYPSTKLPLYTVQFFHLYSPSPQNLSLTQNPRQESPFSNTSNPRPCLKPSQNQPSQQTPLSWLQTSLPTPSLWPSLQSPTQISPFQFMDLPWPSMKPSIKQPQQINGFLPMNSTKPQPCFLSAKNSPWQMYLESRIWMPQPWRVIYLSGPRVVYQPIQIVWLKQQMKAKVWQLLRQQMMCWSVLQYSMSVQMFSMQFGWGQLLASTLQSNKSLSSRFPQSLSYLSVEQEEGQCFYLKDIFETIWSSSMMFRNFSQGSYQYDYLIVARLPWEASKMGSWNWAGVDYEEFCWIRVEEKTAGICQIWGLFLGEDWRTYSSLKSIKSVSDQTSRLETYPEENCLI